MSPDSSTRRRITMHNRNLFFPVLCLTALNLSASPTTILIETNQVALRFPEEANYEERAAIQTDFNLSLAPLGSTLRLSTSRHFPTNTLRLNELWQPYSGFPILCDQGPRFPDKGILSNGTFTIDISHSFVSNHAQRLLAIRPYSNEMAQVYTFLESLSPTNLQTMTAEELVGQYLWKEVLPGGNPIPENELPFEVQSMRSTLYFPPPLFAFHLSDVGPTNAPPYLWCEIPCKDFRGRLSHNALIFFQNRWWLSAWPFQEGEQQW